MGVELRTDLVTTRRNVLTMAGITAAGVALSRVGFAGAQATPDAQATPVAPDLTGYPELTVTITDDGVTISPESIESGYILMTVVNNSSSGADSGGSSIVGPPKDMSAEDFLAQAQATPEPGSNAFLPAVAYTAKILGGPGNLDSGQTGQAILQVPEGSWFVTGPGNQKWATLTVTAGTPTSQAGPLAALTIREVDFKFNGLENVKAGQQVWRVTNSGTQPHMLVILELPGGTTEEQLIALMESFSSGTPAANGLNPSDIKDAGGVDLQSAGTVIYPVMNLDAGTYGAICFVPDPKNGNKPHAMEGMLTVFQVS